MVYIFSTFLITVSATFSVPSCSLSSSVFCIDHTGWCVCSPLLSHLYMFLFQFSSSLLYIYSNCVNFSSPGIPPFSHSLFLQLSFFCFHLFVTVELPFSLSSSLSLSLTFFYALGILSRSSVITFLPVKCWIHGPSPLPLPVAMTTASVFSFIGEG